MILTLAQAIALKKAIAEYFSEDIHFHDCCPGQYFTLDNANEPLQDYIKDYCKIQGWQANFSEDGIQFTIQRAK